MLPVVNFIYNILMRREWNKTALANRPA